jgi:Ca2+-binding RTX toxin-like protein
MTRILRTSVVLLALTAGSIALGGTAHAATAANGKRCTIVGTSGANIIHGTAGNDVICGLGGDDHLYGMGGNDFLDGGDGYDQLWGGSGTDQLSGGPGGDTAMYDDHRTAVRAFLDGKADSGTGSEHDTLGKTVENIFGGKGNDLLIGNSANNVLYGDDGDDLVDGGAGNDHMFGGRGIDEITYELRNSAVHVSLDNTGNDGQASRHERDNVYDDFEVLVGSAYNDGLTGSRYGDAIYGLGGNDGLTGGGGPDYLDGGTGIDTALYADHPAGAEVSIDAKPNDGYKGEGDNVQMNVENLRGGKGNDVLRGNAASNGLQGMAGNDFLFGNGSHDALDGGDGNDHLEGGDSDDTLRGGTGDDLLVGGNGADILMGDQGKDRLLGSSDNDRMDGGPEADTLAGGGGVNVCVSPIEPGATDCQVQQDYFDFYRPLVPFVYGHLLDSTGAPLAGGYVGGRPTGPDGAFGYVIDAYNNDSSGIRVGVPDSVLRHGLELVNHTKVTHDSVVDLTFPAPATVTVHVLDTDGQPVKDAQVSATITTTRALVLNPDLPAFGGVENPPAQDLPTDATGTVTFSTYASELGQVRTTLIDPVAGPLSDELKQIPITGDRTVNLVLDRHPSVVSGTVSRSGGPALSGVKVSEYVDGVRYGNVTSAANGSYSVALPKADGRLNLVSSAQAGLPALDLTGAASFASGDRSLPLTVPTPQTFTVHVQDHAGKPVPGAVVDGGASQVSLTLNPDLGAMTGTQTVAPATTNAAGDALVTGYPSSYVSAVVTLAGGVSGTHVLRSLVSFDGTSDTIVLDTSALLAGSVVDADGTAVQGVTVLAEQPSYYYGSISPTTDSQTTAANGSWSMAVGPGTRYLGVQGTGLPHLPSAFSFSPGYSGSTALHLVARAVTVTVTHGGVAVVGASVTALADTQALAIGVYGKQTPVPAGLVTDSQGKAVFYAFQGYVSGLRAESPVGASSPTYVNIADKDVAVAITL